MSDPVLGAMAPSVSIPVFVVVAPTTNSLTFDVLTVSITERFTLTKPTPRQRLFTNEFKVGERVYVIRHEHGWHDGNLEGNITSMTAHCAVVKSDDGGIYYIDHPRDIGKCH